MDNYNNVNNFDADKYIAQEKRRKRKTVLTVVIVVALIGISFFAGMGIGSGMLMGEDEAANMSILKMIEIERLLKEKYLWEVDSEAMWDNAVKGFVYGLEDIYTSYMNPEEAKEYEESQSGEFDGIGVQIRNTEEMNTFVVNVFNDSPAEKAGMKNGDIIVSADDVSLIGAGIDKAVTYIRGEKGTTVKIGIMREGYNEIIYLDVTREHIEYHDVSYKMLEDNIGYIKIDQFSSGCDEDFEKYAEKLLDDGMKTLIIDLRSNPGGYLYCALNIADLLMPESLIIYTEDNNGNREDHYSDKGRLDVEVIVLINEESASASEVLSGALSDTGNAIIVGKQSYGKGVVQQPVDFIDGATLKYVCEEYMLPSGAHVHGIGITPDYEVEYGTDGTDHQLEKAIELAKQN
ncbi:MAG: S41 family peptidase [Anaerofustis stercorihominis]|nr:S41 family peptidase [Anaerofustis stercorihominis]